MAGTSVKKQTLTGAIWKFAERVSSQIVSFVISVVLARILAPDDYGLIALVVVFTSICDKLVVAGFATSLIQKKDADDKDFSSVLYFSLLMAFVLYSVLFVCSPLIADFYSRFDRNLLIHVIRVYGLNLFIISFNSVQHAYVSRHMLFKRNFWSTFGATIISGTIGIVMAYSGFGVWALVAQNMSATIIGLVILIFTVKWYPKLLFSFSRLKGLFSYGWKLLCSTLIKTIYNDLRGLVIGKVYTPSDLAFYNRGQMLPQLVDSNITGTIDAVLFPAYSKLQDDKPALVSAMRRAMKTSCFILMPSLALLAALANPIVTVLLTDKWLPCVPFMQILCFSYMLSPMEVENMQSIKAIGRSDAVLKLEIIKRVLCIILMLCSVPLGLKAIAWSMLIGNILSAAISAYPNKGYIGYAYKDQLNDVLPSVLMSIVVFVSVSSVLYFCSFESSWVELILGGISGLTIYIAMSIIFKVEAFKYLIKLKNTKNE